MSPELPFCLLRNISLYTFTDIEPFTEEKKIAMFVICFLSPQTFFKYTLYIFIYFYVISSQDIWQNQQVFFVLKKRNMFIVKDHTIRLDMK